MKFNIPKQLTNIRLENITRVSAILLRQGAVHAFEVSIVLVMISVMLGMVVYFRYIAFPLEEGGEVSPPEVKSVRFQDDLYSKVLKKLEERQTEFQKAAEESYADPFYPEGLTQKEEGL